MLSSCLADHFSPLFGRFQLSHPQQDKISTIEHCRHKASIALASVHFSVLTCCCSSLLHSSVLQLYLPTETRCVPCCCRALCLGICQSVCLECLSLLWLSRKLCKFFSWPIFAPIYQFTCLPAPSSLRVSQEQSAYSGCIFIASHMVDALKVYLGFVSPSELPLSLGLFEVSWKLLKQTFQRNKCIANSKNRHSVSSKVLVFSTLLTATLEGSIYIENILNKSCNVINPGP